MLLRELVLNTPTFPYLWVPHCILMNIALRATLGIEHGPQFARQHPLSCLLLALLYNYPGALLANLLLAKPLLSFLLISHTLYATLLAWYLVFYSPQDLFYRLIMSSKLVPVLAALQDWLRIGLVLSGLQTINDESPGHLFYPVIFALIKSSGFMLVKYAEHVLLHGLNKAFSIPNQASKTMLFAAVVLQVQMVYGLLPLSETDLYCYLVLLAVILRLLTAAFTEGEWDPYAGFEHGLCTLLYGPASQTVSQPAEDKKKN